LIAIFLKTALLFILGWIAYQDIKQREVWNYHFILFGIIGTFLFFSDSLSIEFYLLSILINVLLVVLILLLTKISMKVIFKRDSNYLGLGDVFFFFAFAVSFPTMTFINFFVFAILFTFVSHLLVKKIFKPDHKTIPLAGFMSIFLVCIYLANWFGFYQPLYSL
jgi:Flp pilus assembly protein protease CpaA